MSKTALPLHSCPCCHHELDAIKRMAGPGAPHPGGVSICVYCAGLNIITDDLTLRRATPAELERHLQDPRIIASIEFVLRLMDGRARGVN